jgi:hypothetical protein
MIGDCFHYYKGCECQQLSNLQLVPVGDASYYQAMAISRLGTRVYWPNQIHSSSSKEHRFVLVATNYSTKWTKAIPLKNMTHKKVIRFNTEHIIYRFNISQTLTTDRETSFVSKKVHHFAELYKIKLLNSSPYYAQTNGQA